MILAHVLEASQQDTSEAPPHKQVAVYMSELRQQNYIFIKEFVLDYKVPLSGLCQNLVPVYCRMSEI